MSSSLGSPPSRSPVFSRAYWNASDGGNKNNRNGGASLRFKSAAASIPHPEKVSRGGEDAYFVAPDGGAFGVFDGVGGWSEVGVDPGIYSRSLAAQCFAAYEELGAERPTHLLERAWLNSQHIVGSSTACCVTLAGSKLRAANLGDSGFLVVRDGKLLHMQKEQQHGFNFPFQMGTNSSDTAMDAQVVELDVQPGDVVVAGTDGVFDNVFAADIVSLVTEGVELGKSEAEMAERIAFVASRQANSVSAKSPFGVAARKVGYTFEGGKLDDITVVVGFVEEASAVSSKL